MRLRNPLVNLLRPSMRRSSFSRSCLDLCGVPPRLEVLTTVREAGSKLAFGLCVAATSWFGCTTQARGPLANAPAAPSAAADYTLTQSSASRPNRGGCSVANGCLGDDAKATLGRCDAESCNGDLSAQTIAELRAAANDTKDCYERELKDNPKLEGKLAVRMRLAEGRDVCEIGLDNSSLSGSETFMACITERLRQVRARPDSGCVDIVLPLSFVRHEIDAPAGTGAAGAASTDKR